MFCVQHLCVLLACPDLDVVLAVLNLLYVFSKRSNFISRLAPKKRSHLNSYLEYLAEVCVCMRMWCGVGVNILYPHVIVMGWEAEWVWTCSVLY